MRNDFGFKVCGMGLLLIIGVLGRLSPPTLAIGSTATDEPVLVAQASSSVTQAGNLAGYVLNSETNMGHIYAQSLNRDLMNSPGSQVDGPLIQYVGPPPQPPAIGPIFQRSTHARPLAPRHGL
jgi:hypothetical protein